MAPRELWSLVKEAIASWVDDGASSMGAALAYYTVFSLAPLLLMVIAIAGLVFGADAAQGALLQQFTNLIGSNGAQAIQAILTSAHNWQGGLFSVAISVITLLVGATSVFAELQRDLDLIWKVRKKLKTNAIFSFARTRLLSFGLIVGVGFLLIVSLAVSAGIAAVSTLWGNWLDGVEFLLQLINIVISFGVITVLFALIYKVLPNFDIAWSDVWMGAAVTSVLFAVGKFAIGLYIGNSGVANSFGAAGSMIALLLWVYYSAQVFVLGAEFARQYALQMGSLRNKPGVQPSGAKVTRIR